MDPIIGEAPVDRSAMVTQEKYQIAQGIKKPSVDEVKEQLELIRELAAAGNNQASIEKFLEMKKIRVNATVRQDIWLALNHEELSASLREHHSAVLSPILSNPATSGNIRLDLTPEQLNFMREQMPNRLERLQKAMEQQSGVRWGVKVYRHAKWEYLKDEIVALHRWLKQQPMNTTKRGMSTVKQEMQRRYGTLFDFRQV
jgi:hypothetical protein